METNSFGFVFILLVAGSILKCGMALRLEGEVESDSGVAHIGQFVFDPEIRGKMEYELKMPADDCYGCRGLLVISEPTQEWLGLKPMTCSGEWRLLSGMQRREIRLDAGTGNCRSITEDGQRFTHCKGTLLISHPEYRLHYLTIMNCNGNRDAGIKATYKFHLVNGRNGITAEFSADESSNLHMTAACTLLLAVILCAAFINSFELNRRRLLHVTYRIWAVALLIHVVGMIIMSCAWMTLAMDGFERPIVRLVGEVAVCAGTVVFVVMLNLVSRGYTITRLQIGAVGKLKVATLGSMFAAAYAGLYLMKETTDPVLMYNVYDSPIALGAAGLRVLGALWCLYDVYFSVRNFPAKRDFYGLFAVFLTVWFISQPVVMIFAKYYLPLYCSAKYVYGADLAVAVFGHAVFLCLTKPSVTNNFFPYHLHTNKVDKDSFWDMHDLNHGPKAHTTFDIFLAKQKEECTREAMRNAKAKEIYSGSMNIILAGAKEVTDRGDRLVAIPSISGTVPHRCIEHFKDQTTLQEKTQPTVHAMTQQEGKKDNGDAPVAITREDPLKHEEEMRATLPPKPKFYKPAPVKKTAIIPLNRCEVKKDVGDALVAITREDPPRHGKEMETTSQPKPTFYQPAMKVRVIHVEPAEAPFVKPKISIDNWMKAHQKLNAATAKATSDGDKAPTPGKIERYLKDDTLKATSQGDEASTPAKERVIHVEPTEASFVRPKKLINNWMEYKAAKNKAMEKNKSVAADHATSTPVRAFQYPKGAVVLPVTKLDEAMPSISGGATFLRSGDNTSSVPKELANQSAVGKLTIKLGEASLPGAVPDDDELPTMESVQLGRNGRLTARYPRGPPAQPIKYLSTSGDTMTFTCGGACPPGMVPNDDMLKTPKTMELEPSGIRNNSLLRGAPARSIKYVEMNRRMLSRPMTEYKVENELPLTPCRNNCMTKGQRQHRIQDINNCLAEVQQKEECILEMLQNDMPVEETVEHTAKVFEYVNEVVEKVKRKKKRNPVHKAQKILGIKRKKKKDENEKNI